MYDGTESSVFVKNNNYLPEEVINYVENKIKEINYGGHSPIPIIKDILELIINLNYIIFLSFLIKLKIQI
jgi:hypothetical protein